MSSAPQTSKGAIPSGKLWVRRWRTTPGKVNSLTPIRRKSEPVTVWSGLRPEDGRWKPVCMGYQVFSTLRKETAESEACPFAGLLDSHLLQEKLFRHFVRNLLKYRWKHTELSFGALTRPNKLGDGRSIAAALVQRLDPTQLLLGEMHGVLSVVIEPCARPECRHLVAGIRIEPAN